MSSAIELSGVGKRYRQFARQDMLVKRLLRGGRRVGQEFWALHDIDLEVGRGETLGIVGRNGSGKTTLLRLISGVSAPSTGRVVVRGSIAPLIGVGVGFNQELTGRENVEMNGQLLGLSASEVRRQFDDIVDFSEISRFIDSPVKYYSSGMFLRLAFSVAVHVRPEVLVVDEVLAVGDLAFQLKCNQRMRDIQADGTTIVIVTHSLQTLDRLAPRAVVLSAGRIVFDGPTTAAIGEYHKLLGQGDGAAGPVGAQLSGAPVGPPLTTVAGVAVTARIETRDGQDLTYLEPEQPFRVRVEARFDGPLDDPQVGFMLSHDIAGPCFSTFSAPTSGRRYGPDRPFVVSVDMVNRLLGGTYSALASVGTADGTIIGQTSAIQIYVTSQGLAHGVVDMGAVLHADGDRIDALPDMRLG